MDFDFFSINHSVWNQFLVHTSTTDSEFGQSICLTGLGLVSKRHSPRLYMGANGARQLNLTDVLLVEVGRSLRCNWTYKRAVKENK